MASSPNDVKLIAPESLAPDELKVIPKLAAAIREGGVDEVARLLGEHPVQKSVWTPFGGQTWLGYAAWVGQMDVVKTLIDAGLNMNDGDRWDGTNALDSAISGGHREVAEYLLDNGAAMDVSASVRNPLFAATVAKAPDIVALLLRRGVDSTIRYDSPTMKNMDAVAFAMMQGEREIARMIALHNSGGDEAGAEAAMAEGLRIAHDNTQPPSPE